MVLTVAAVTLGLAVGAFTGYQARTSAQRAAQVFSRDLALARSAAKRGREPVLVRFDEDAVRYSIVTGGGRTLVDRRFDGGDDIRLSGIDLDLPGDTVRFDGRGFASMEAGADGLGSAAFAAGPRTWEVAFNALGASNVRPR